MMQAKKNENFAEEDGNNNLIAKLCDKAYAIQNKTLRRANANLKAKISNKSEPAQPEEDYKLLWEQLAQEVLKMSKMLSQASKEIENYIDEGKQLRAKISELEGLAAKTKDIADLIEERDMMKAKVDEYKRVVHRKHVMTEEEWENLRRYTQTKTKRPLNRM